MIMIRKHSFTKHVLPILILTPYIVAFHPDSSSTVIRFGAGIGSYADVTRDCNGNIERVDPVPFTDATIAIDHENAPLHLEARAGIFSEDRQVLQTTYTNGYFLGSTRTERQVSTYANPTIGLQWKYFGIDAGCVWFGGRGPGDLSFGSRAIPQGSLRIGDREVWYWSMGIFNNEPLVSGGGLIDMGLGFSLDQRHSTLWLGVGGGVYDGTVYSVKSTIAITDKWLLNLRVTAGDNAQLAGSIGAGFRL
jgi:hypothetical protein